MNAPPPGSVPGGGAGGHCHVDVGRLQAAFVPEQAEIIPELMALFGISWPSERRDGQVPPGKTDVGKGEESGGPFVGTSPQSDPDAGLDLLGPFPSPLNLSFGMQSIRLLVASESAGLGSTADSSSFTAEFALCGLTADLHKGCDGLPGQSKEKDEEDLLASFGLEVLTLSYSRSQRTSTRHRGGQLGSAAEWPAAAVTGNLPPLVIDPCTNKRLDPLTLPAVWASLARPALLGRIPFRPPAQPKGVQVHLSPMAGTATDPAGSPPRGDTSAPLALSPVNMPEFLQTRPDIRQDSDASHPALGAGLADLMALPADPLEEDNLRPLVGSLSAWSSIRQRNALPARLSEAALTAAAAAAAAVDPLSAVLPQRRWAEVAGGGDASQQLSRAFERPRSVARRSFRASGGLLPAAPGGLSPPTDRSGGTLYSRYRSTESSGPSGALGIQVCGLHIGNAL